jgi:hypothetical protein
MAIELEKILSVTAQEYVGANVNVREQYELKGIHFSELTYKPARITMAVQNFAEKVPDNTEAVVGYQNNTSATGRVEKQYYIQITGTALVPKK